MGRVNMSNITQSSDLMRFISTLSIDPNGDILTNVIDTEEPNFISRFYIPHLKVSELGSTISKKINLGEIEQTGKKLDNNTLTIQLMNSGLALEHPYMYKLSQSIILDAFSVVYAIEEDPSLLQGIEVKDLTQTRTNIKYLIDFLGNKHEYVEIVERLHNLSVAIGYIENQLPILRGAVNG